jgi:hypothetical protein
MLNEPVVTASKTCYGIYNQLRKQEEKLGECAPFHLMPVIAHIPFHLWMGLVPVEVHLIWLRATDFSASSISSFLRAHELRPMECILEDPNRSDEEKEVMIKQRWSWLADQPRMSSALRFLSTRDFFLLKEKSVKLSSSIGFLQLLHLYDYPDRGHLLLLDILGKNVLEHPSKRKRRSCVSGCGSAATRFLTIKRQLPWLCSVFRPWIPYDFHTMLIQPVESTTSTCTAMSSYLGKQVRKGWFEPAMRFHQAYLEKGGGVQKGNVYECSTAGNLKFRIVYGVGEDSWRLQNEDTLAREKAWASRSRLLLSVTALQKHLCMDHLPDGSIVARSVYYDLSAHDDDDVLLPLSLLKEVVCSCSQHEKEKVADVLSRIYHVYGRLCRKEPLAPYHTSLRYKMKHLLHRDARLFTTPVGFLFPEYYYYSQDERALLDNAWKKASDRFVSRMLVAILGRESGFTLIKHSNNSSTLSLPRIRQAVSSEERCLVYSQASEEHLKINAEILDLLDDDEVMHLDEETIRQGGRHQNRPIVVSTTDDHTAVSDIDGERKKMNEEDIEAFIQELEQGKVMITAELEDIEVDTTTDIENPEALDDEVIDEDGLEEVEVDVDEFYGGE